MTKDNLEKIANLRRQEGLKRYLMAIFFAVITVGIAWLLAIANQSGLAIFPLVFGVVIAIKLAMSGNRWMARSADVNRGIAAENEVASILEFIARQGWKIEYNLMLSPTWDADVVLRSPHDNWFVIDVKSHGGTKFVNSEGKLQRKYGLKTYNFPGGEPVEKVKEQARIVCLKKDAPWVTPMLCFTEGKVDIPGVEIDGVFIVFKDELLSQLLSLDN